MKFLFTKIYTFIYLYEISFSSFQCMGMIDVCETLHSHGFRPDPATSPSSSRRRRSATDGRKPSNEGRRPSIEGRKLHKDSRKASAESSSSSSNSRKASLEQRPSLDGKKLPEKEDRSGRTASAEDRLTVQAPGKEAARTSSYYLEGPLDEDDYDNPQESAAPNGEQEAGSPAEGSSVESHPDPT